MGPTLHDCSRCGDEVELDDMVDREDYCQGCEDSVFCRVCETWQPCENDFEICETCADHYTECPNCGSVVDHDHIITHRATWGYAGGSPEEYSCTKCGR